MARVEEFVANMRRNPKRLLLAVISKPTGADGIAIEIEWSPHHDLEMPAQKAILVYDEQSQREDLILSIELA